MTVVLAVVFGFLVFLIIAAWVAMAAACGNVARRKGRSRFGWYCLGMLSGPIGLLLAHIVSSQPGFEVAMVRPCPYCAERVRYEAIVCKHCGREIPRGERPAAKILEAPGKVSFVYWVWATLVSLFLLFVVIVSVA
jgi:hypothetical protein